jgi:hypothetical protein
MTTAPSTATLTQLPLIHCVESDDVYLRERGDVLWYRFLTTTTWGDQFRAVGAQYYEALWQFNAEQAQAQAERLERIAQSNPETKQEATTRLLFERTTLREDAPILASGPPDALPLIHVNPAAIAPGVPPPRLAGRTPKCFFALFRAFMALAVKGRASEPETVYEELRDNPSFARACGFTLPDPAVGYRASDVPSLRKLEQFDQIMTDRGLWDVAAVQRVSANLKEGIVETQDTGIHDVTHFLAFSELRTVELPEKHVAEGAEAASKVGTESSAPAPLEGKPLVGKESAKDSPTEGRGKDKPKPRKSHPKTTKNCRCEDRDACSHEWVSADPGAGTIVKGGGKRYWGHKASTLTFAGGEGVLLDAVAMTDGASHDSKSVVPHMERLYKNHPELNGVLTRLLDDSAADDATLKATLKERFGVELLTAPNPRGRKPITTDLACGVDHVTTQGVPVCRAGVHFDFLGSRHEEKRFLFRAPDAPVDGKQTREGPLLLPALTTEAKPICEGCPVKPDCCRDGAERRHVSIPFERLPWIDPAFPQISVSFQKEMAQRTVIERLHKLMKNDYGNEGLTKRGTKAFQARLDKTKLAMHLVLALPATDSS